jgi:hypothetical protein
MEMEMDSLAESLHSTLKLSPDELAQMSHTKQDVQMSLDQLSKLSEAQRKELQRNVMQMFSPEQLAALNAMVVAKLPEMSEQQLCQMRRMFTK